MRILHLLNHIQNIGNGIVNVAIDLACLQSKSGHVVAIAAGQGTIAERCDHETYQPLLTTYGVHYYDLNQKRKFANLLQDGWSISTDYSRLSARHRTHSHDDRRCAGQSTAF